MDGRMMLLASMAIILSLCMTVNADHEPECCDACLLLEDPTSDFTLKCGNLLHPIMLSKMIKDCEKNQNISDGALSVFLSSVKEVCYYRTRSEVTFYCPEPPVDCPLCDAIMLTECGQNMHWVMRNKIRKDCRKIMTWGQVFIDAFIENIEGICDHRNLSFEMPDCFCGSLPCDECEDIPNTPCGASMHEIIRNKLVKDCENVRGQGAQNFQTFWDNLAEVCVFRGYPEFVPPYCPEPENCTEVDPTCVGECDYCAEMVDPNSSFRQICGPAFEDDATFIDFAIETCFSLQLNLTTMRLFIDDLVNTCISESETYFEFCKYEPPTPIPPPIPECDDKRIDIVFVVDSSNSIGSFNYGLVRNFLNSAIDKLDIGASNTRVGILHFSEVVTVDVQLGDISTKAGLHDVVDNMAYDAFDTWTHLAIGAANLMLTGRGRMDAAHVVVLITDGRSTYPELTFPAMHTFRADHPEATVIAVGIEELGSPFVLAPELRAMATGLGDTNVFNVESFDNLDGIVNDLAVQTCIPVNDDDGIAIISDDPDGEDYVVTCMEVLFGTDGLSRFEEYYGVYELLEQDPLCQGVFVYRHTSGNFFIWREASNLDIIDEPIWQVNTHPCDPNGLVLAHMANDDVDMDPLTNGMEYWIETAPFSPAYTTCFGASSP